MKLDPQIVASHSEPDSQKQTSESFGDTETEEGLVRLLDFIKLQHLKCRLRDEPKAILRLEKVEKYRAQKDPSRFLVKKGLQLRKAA